MGPTQPSTCTNKNPGYTAKVVKPKMIGVHGPALSTFNPASCAIYESQGTPVEPRSLYLAQLVRVRVRVSVRVRVRVRSRVRVGV